MANVKLKLLNRFLGIYQSAMRWGENIPVSLSMRPTEKQILKHLVVSDNPLILDVGANVGSMTSFYKKVFPGAVIHAFEPHFETYEALSRRVNNLSGVTAHNVAVGEGEDVMTLYTNTVSATNSFFKVNSNSDWAQENSLIKPNDEKQVDVISLDIFCEKNEISFVDFLKIDVQGFEPKCLKGAKRLLEQNAINAIKLEVMPGDFYETSTTLFEIEQILTEYGYSLWTMMQFHYGKHGELRYFDAYFVRSSK